MLTPEQLSAVEARGKLICVDAGAGSGKTRVLVQRIVHLIEHDGVQLNQVAAITFTEKAAAEMKSRLRAAFRQKADPEDRAMFSRWRQMERQVDTARICTIHAFCSGLLRENALSLGIDPDYAILTEAESGQMRSEAIESTLHRLLDDGDPAARLLAVEYGPFNLSELLDELLRKRGLMSRVISGGAAAAAEEMLVEWERTWPLLENTLLLGFCQSRDVVCWVRKLTGAGGICSDDSDKREVLRRTLLEHLGQLRHETKSNRIRALLDAMRELKATGGKPAAWGNDKEAFDCVRDVLKDVRTKIDKLDFPPPDPVIEAHAANVTAALIQTFRLVELALQKDKASRNALDFDDLIVEVARVLGDTARGEDSVCARTARAIKHLLIDEFQDTDGVQFAIAKCLSSAPGGPDLFYVGDAKQSIYYFRGAEVDVFARAREAAQHALPLLGNWRTSPAVLQFINQFFDSSQLLNAVEHSYRALSPNRARTGVEQVEFLIPSTRADKTKLDDYREEEAALVAARLRTLCEGGAQVFDPKVQGLRPACYGDAAILLRSFSNVHLYEQALRDAGVPYTLVAGKGFYERPEILDIRNLLRVVVDPWDELALIGFLRGPIVGLQDDSLVLIAGGPGAPVGIVNGFRANAQLVDAEEDVRLTRAREIVARLRAHADRPLSEFLHLLMDITAFEGIVHRLFMGVQRASNVRKLTALAGAFSRAETPRLRAFLRYLDDLAAREIREGEAAAHNGDTRSVTIMTVHKAKGLEFPFVFVADLARTPQVRSSSGAIAHRNFGLAAKVLGPDGEFVAPRLYTGIAALRALEEQAEEARILYVAMTRTRDHLILCGAPKAAKGSWLNAFDDSYDVCGKSDGDAIDGDGW
ncbi:MAG: UvrD-helicase domain-containing protein, partial [Candidatus Hydrogenedentes bacterium]|nr:UvrD-helicase domain-containing protein [Candidatus Hydrogenedentota bacterium]